MITIETCDIELLTNLYTLSSLIYNNKHIYYSIIFFVFLFNGKYKGNL